MPLEEEQESNTSDILPKTYEIELINASVTVDGFTLQVLSALENDGLDITELQKMGALDGVNHKPWTIIEKSFYYMVKYTTHTEAYANLKFDDFRRLLSPKIKPIALINKIAAMIQDAYGVDNESSNDDNKKEYQSKKK